jgi:hypothetical protein
MGTFQADGQTVCCCGTLAHQYLTNQILSADFATVNGYTAQPGDRIVVAYYADQYPINNGGALSGFDIGGDFFACNLNSSERLYFDNPPGTRGPGWLWCISHLDNTRTGAPYNNTVVQTYNNPYPFQVDHVLLHWWIIRGADTNPFVSFTRVTPTLDGGGNATLSITTPKDNCCVLGVAYPVGGPNSINLYDWETVFGGKWNYTADGREAAPNIGLTTFSTINGQATTSNFFHQNLGPAGIKTASVRSTDGFDNPRSVTIDYIILNSAPTKTLTTMS